MFRADRNQHQAALKEPLTPQQARELRLRYRQLGLALGMLVSGTANTLTCKAAFSITSEGHVFNHPFVQAGAMFVGEVAVMIYFLVSSRLQGKRIRLPLKVFASFALPACCDIVGTSTMYAGLTMTNASTYQMLRGASAPCLRRARLGARDGRPSGKRQAPSSSSRASCRGCCCAARHARGSGSA